jgi:endoglucanase
MEDSLISISKYKNALKNSILFYEAQMSGILPEWHRIPWRKDSAVQDGFNKK